MKSQNNEDTVKMLRTPKKEEKYVLYKSSYIKDDESERFQTSQQQPWRPDGNSLQISQGKLLYFQLRILYPAHTLFIVSNVKID